MTRRRKRELAALDQDIRDHIAQETRDNIECGMPPEDARRAAWLKFGNVAMAKEDARAVWIPVWIEQMLQDARYGLRMLRRNPGFSAVVILTLALGIGMNTAVFSVVNAVLLRPLSYPNSERLVWLATQGPGIPFNMELVARQDFADWREQAASFERIAAYDTQNPTITTANDATRSRIASVSDDFWDLADVRAAVGRIPRPGERDVLLLSHGFFERWFHGDPNIAGSAVTVNGRQVTITGVLPKNFLFQFPHLLMPGFSAAKAIDGYTPMIISPKDRVRHSGFGGRFSNVVAKLKPGVPIDRAEAELAAIRARAAHANPAWKPNQARLIVLPLHEKLVGRTRLTLWVLLAAVVFVLLIVCVNIANLLLARASVRRKEIAIRASVGAGRARVLRQLLVESMVHAVLGGAAGLLLARWSLAIMLRLFPYAVPRLAEATIAGNVLAFAAGASILTAILFGVGPAISLWKTNVQDALKDGARTSSATSGSVRFRKLLVAIELALAVVLLSGAGLMVKSFWRMNAHPPGFEPERILVMKVDLSGSQYRDMPRQCAYVEELRRQLEPVPGVEGVGIITPDSRTVTDIVRSGTRPTPSAPRHVAVFNVTSAAAAKVMGLRVVRGRWITDTEPTPAVAINERFARHEFGTDDPVGRRFNLPGGSPATIVGVVADLRYSKLDTEPEPELYVPYRYGPIAGMTVMVKMTRDPLTVAPAIRKLVSGIDKAEQPYDVMTMEQALADSIAPSRFNLFLLGTFAAAALSLALIGIYGVISYSVVQRTHEIGVRMALGAQRGEVIRMVVRQGFGIAATGIALGLAAAFGLTRVMVSLLYDVKPTDPETFTAVAAVLATTALAACGVPAFRAALVDPVIALRYE